MSKQRHIYAQDISFINFDGKRSIVQIAKSSQYILPTPTVETKGTHDYQSCAMCQKNFKILLDWFESCFEGKQEGSQPFPCCCSSHLKLVKLENFKRDDFLKVPEWSAYKIIYVRQHIKNNCHKSDWYKEITDYLEYTIRSFGQMLPEHGEPLYLSDFIKETIAFIKAINKLSNNQKDALLNYLRKYTASAKERNKDFNVLVMIYEKWYKVFPFELSIFSSIKEQYGKPLPVIFSHKSPVINPYTNATKLYVPTKGELMGFLLQLTNNILTQVNAYSLHKKGLLTEPKQLQLEYLMQARKLKLKEGYIHNAESEENRYREMLKEWFKDEKKFINELTILLPDQPKAIQAVPVPSKADSLQSHLMQYGFYELPMIKSLSTFQQKGILNLLTEKRLPYQIAMFDFLDYLEYLEQNHCNSKNEMYKRIAKWLNSDTGGRSVKGNINSLQEISQEDRTRYTAYKHKESAEKDYENLK